MRVLDVAEATEYIRDLVEFDPVLSDLWIRGEVSNVSRSAAGHTYFCLLSDASQLNCVLFRGNHRGLLSMPRNGDEVLAHGRVSIYPPRGQYQLIVDNVAPEGTGVLQLLFEETKRRLAADGLFDEGRKRPLPFMPSVIGVVTSAQGAVWHDIQQIIARRFPLVELVLSPSAVQGHNAPDELIAGLEALQELDRCDVIIVGRGGGASEDLAAFNDERLARAIFACRAPVVSAVGHETDVTIADMVADVRAPTPSAAAELCVPNGREVLAVAGLLVRRARALALQSLDSHREALIRECSDLSRCDPRRSIQSARVGIDHECERATRALSQSLLIRADNLGALSSRAALLDPRDVLRRGYAIVSAIDDGVERRVTRAKSATRSGDLRVTFSDGDILATVRKEAS